MATNVLVKREHTAKAIVSGLYARRLDILLIIIVLIFSFSVRYATLMDMGITWDEPDYIHAGIVYANNLLNFDFNSDAYSYNSEHPPVSKYLYGMAIWAFNGGSDNLNAYVVAKTVSAILGAATCVILYLIGREFFSARVAFLSAIILALIPDFVAHTQIAAIDGPVAFFFTLTMYLFMMAVRAKNKIYYLASAISLGLLIDTKLTGLLALPVMALFFLAQRYSTARDTKAKLAGRLRHYLPLPYIAGFLLIAVATAFIIYPWIWGGINNLMLTLDHWNTSPSPKYFLGSIQQAPLGYYPVYFLVTTPALLFLPLVLGIFFVLKTKDPYKLAILIWFIVPFAYDLGSFKQDGMRYILMIYPAVALLCGEGIRVAADRIGPMLKRSWKTNTVFTILGLLTTLYLVATLASVSPYYLDYYNVLAGGPGNVYKNNLFEFGWWGEGIYDSAMYIEHDASPNSRVYLAASPTHVVDIYRKNVIYIDPRSKSMIVNDDSVSYILSNAYTDQYSMLSFDRDRYKLVHVTEVQGAPLARVYKRMS